ncbi:MAG: hypothetical protein JJT95_07460 [Pararhodobacter sp.]|nr:hypothetical protein [Pararhodobacter sp.]
MRAVVHIGSPKTGTSSIQAFLASNWSPLKAQGFRYERFEPNRGSQFEFAAAALTLAGEQVSPEHRLRYGYPDMEAQRVQTAALQDWLRRRRKNWAAPTVLISSEHILAWVKTNEAIAALDHMLRELFDPVTYILYLRRQEDMIVSAYSESIKRGGKKTLESFVQSHGIRQNYFKKVNRWVKVVGRDRLDVRLLEKDFLHQGDLIADFCHACDGIDMSELKMPPRSNEALSAEAAELLRLFNEHTPELLPDGSRDPLGQRLRDRLMAHSAQGSRLALTQEQRQQIIDSHAVSNEKLRRNFFSQRESLFPPVAEPAVARDPAALREDALRLATRLLGDADLVGGADLVRPKATASHIATRIRALGRRLRNKGGASRLLPAILRKGVPNGHSRR